MDTSSIEDRTAAALRQAVAFHFIWQRRVSRKTWHTFRSQCPLAIPTAPRTTRATRSTRTATSRRTTSMSRSTRRSDADDGGGEPDPAPLGAEGRATGSASGSPGPWLARHEVVLLEREMAQQARRRARYIRDLGDVEEGWA